MLTPASTSQSRITRNDPVVVLNVRVWLRRPPRGPGVRTHTVNVSLPTSRPATRSNKTSMSPPFHPSGDHHLTGSVRRDLCQDTDPRALLATIQRQPRSPRHTPTSGSPAPVCVDVAGRPPILISQCSDSKSATITPHARPEVARVGLTARAVCTPSGGCDDEPAQAHGRVGV